MGKPWPHDTHEKLTAAGYIFLTDGPCKSETCKTTVHWYRTPKGKEMPFSDVAESSPVRLQPHFASCSEAARFTTRGKAKEAASGRAE